VLFADSGCHQSTPAMPKWIFDAAVDRCHLEHTSYTSRKGWFLDEPLIDFSAEPDRAAAQVCFDKARDEIDSAYMAKTGATQVSYIWEAR
jgi:hypothetical protein